VDLQVEDEEACGRRDLEEACGQWDLEEACGRWDLEEACGRRDLEKTGCRRISRRPADHGGQLMELAAAG
jgi:hypothetical protein